MVKKLQRADIIKTLAPPNVKPRKKTSDTIINKIPYKTHKEWLEL